MQRIEMKVCPYCHKKRPLDWFGKRARKIIVSRKGTHEKVNTIYYRKFKACWKCRALHEKYRHEVVDPLQTVPLHYRTPAYLLTVEKSRVAEDDVI